MASRKGASKRPARNGKPAVGGVVVYSKSGRGKILPFGTPRPSRRRHIAEPATYAELVRSFGFTRKEMAEARKFVDRLDL